MEELMQANVYNTGLNESDWKSLRDVILPFIHARKPLDVAIRQVPQHLTNHPLIDLIKKYKETGERSYLDQAGQCLIPTKEPFGWYVPLLK